MSLPSICLISSGCVSMSPRTVKFADALSAAGFPVSVVAVQTEPLMVTWDALLVSTRSWKYHPILATWGPPRASWIRALSGVRFRIAKLLYRRLGQKRFLATALSRFHPELFQTAKKLRADCTFAQDGNALPAAHLLLSTQGTPFLYDPADYLAGSTLGPEDIALIRDAESQWATKATHVFAPSQGVATALSATYGLGTPAVIRNVFPWNSRKKTEKKTRDRRGHRFSLVWFSQTITMARGLSNAITALGKVQGDFELHVRGTITDAVRHELWTLARDMGIGKRVYFHDRVHPDELIFYTQEHDIGLAVDAIICENYDLTIPNKLYFYMLSGLAIIATDTKGQRSVLESHPGIGHLVPQNDPDALANAIQSFIDSPKKLTEAKEASLELAKNLYNWEKESEKFVATVRASLHLSDDQRKVG